MASLECWQGKRGAAIELNVDTRVLLFVPCSRMTFSHITMATPIGISLDRSWAIGWHNVSNCQGLSKQKSRPFERLSDSGFRFLFSFASMRPCNCSTHSRPLSAGSNSAIMSRRSTNWTTCHLNTAPASRRWSCVAAYTASWRSGVSLNWWRRVVLYRAMRRLRLVAIGLGRC